MNFKMLKSNYKNNLITNSLVDLGDDIAIEGNGKGRHFTSRFIEAGIAEYKGTFGKVLITKETLDKFINSMVGCPVIIKHKDITDENADKERVGVVSRVWFNEADGWYWCEGIIWDKQAIDLVKNQGWSVSCTYDFESDNQKGVYHGLDYDREFTDGNFLHLALVPNPRYEKAEIIMNSKAENEDKWITIHPNGEDGKGRHLLLKDGESPKEAIERTYGKEDKKDDKKESDNKKFVSPDGKKYSIDDLTKEGFKPVRDKKTKSAYIEKKADDGFFERYPISEEEYNKLKDTSDKKEGEGKSETKVYTEDDYDEFHKKFYKENDDKWHFKSTIKGFTVSRTKDKKWSYSNIKSEDIDKYLSEDTIKVSLSNNPVERKDKEGTYDWYEDDKKLKHFSDKGYSVTDKYNDGYRTNYILKKVKDKATNSFLNGLDEILTDYKPIKEDLPILEGLKGILGE